jgi:hypothetical protein
MPKYLVKWKINHHMMPEESEDIGKVMSCLMQMVKDDIESGACLSWYMFPESNRGVSFSDQSEEELTATLMKYYPYIFFRVKPLITFDQAMQAFEKQAELCKKYH